MFSRLYSVVAALGGAGVRLGFQAASWATPIVAPLAEEATTCAFAVQTFGGLRIVIALAAIVGFSVGLVAGCCCCHGVRLSQRDAAFGSVEPRRRVAGARDPRDRHGSRVRGRNGRSSSSGSGTSGRHMVLSHARRRRLPSRTPGTADGEHRPLRSDGPGARPHKPSRASTGGERSDLRRGLGAYADGIPRGTRVGDGKLVRKRTPEWEHIGSEPDGISRIGFGYSSSE